MKKNYTLSPLNLFLSIGVLLITMGCIDSSQENYITFFGGKIKNPKGEYVYFSKNGTYLDSARIDANNKFAFHLDSIELGLYVFHHGPEIQFLYLEPKDSLLIYLNTWDFDESLIFSGTQASKNNYLIKLWLEQEKFGKNFSHNYKLNEKEFSELINIEVNNQLNKYDNFIESEGENPSEFFDKLAKTGIHLPLYSLKESYPIRNKKILKLKKFPEVSDDFYDYRKSVDINDSSLISYWPYSEYVAEYVKNKALAKYFDKGEKSIFAMNYMEIVAEEIKIENYKNILLGKSIWWCLSSNDLPEDEFVMVNNYFLEHCTDEKMLEEIEKSITQKTQLKQGNPMPKLVAMNTNGKQIDLNQVSKNKNVVVYFWPKDLANVEYLNKKLSKLERKYPDLLFLGIERNKSNEDWLKFIEAKKLHKDNQFRISKNSENYAYFEGQMARTIILNEQGNVHNGYLFFNTYNFDMHLKEFKKQ